MSWQATAWVSTVEAGGPSGKLLLYALANYADEHGKCWPSDARLIADTELSERAVRDWKRKLEEAGLLAIERRRTAGGTFQADEIRLAMGGRPPANSAGGATGKSCRDHRQMVPEPPANGAVPPTPPYKAEPSEEPPVEPSSERGREREVSEKEACGDDPAKFEKRVKRIAAVHSWPGWANSPTAWSIKQFAALTDAERAEAEAKAGAYIAHCRKKAISLGNYFRERKWLDVPASVIAAQDAPAPVTAAPFGKVWNAIRFERLGRPAAPMPRASSFLEALMTGDTEAGNRARLDRQAKFGWPDVNFMHDMAATGRGVAVKPEDATAEGLAQGFEQVRVGSDLWHAWKQLHEAKGWPWIPDPGSLPYVWFPAGGPDRLADFQNAARGG